MGKTGKSIWDFWLDPKNGIRPAIADYLKENMDLDPAFKKMMANNEIMTNVDFFGQSFARKQLCFVACACASRQPWFRWARPARRGSALH